MSFQTDRWVALNLSAIDGGLSREDLPPVIEGQWGHVRGVFRRETLAPRDARA